MTSTRFGQWILSYGTKSTTRVDKLLYQNQAFVYQRILSRKCKTSYKIGENIWKALGSSIHT